MRDSRPGLESVIDAGVRVMFRDPEPKASPAGRDVYPLRTANRKCSPSPSVISMHTRSAKRTSSSIIMTTPLASPAPPRGNPQKNVRSGGEENSEEDREEVDE